MSGGSLPPQEPPQTSGVKAEGCLTCNRRWPPPLRGGRRRHWQPARVGLETVHTKGLDRTADPKGEVLGRPLHHLIGSTVDWGERPTAVASPHIHERRPL
jgi:hypothetical protein